MEVYERLERLRRRAELEQRLLHAAADPAPSSDHAVPESLSPGRRAGEEPSSEPKALDLSMLLDVGLDVVEPDLVEPGLVEPGLVEPGLVEPGLVEPGLVEPDIGWLVAVEPEAVESDTVEPETEASAVAEPGLVEPGLAEPGAVEPDTIELTRFPVAADGDSPQSPEMVGTSLPIPMTEMVNEVLAALRPVLQRYPGLVVGIWPPGRANEDLNAAIRFTLDAATGLSLRMPDPGSPDIGRVGDGHQSAGRPEPRSVAVELASLLRHGLSDR